MDTDYELTSSNFPERSKGDAPDTSRCRKTLTVNHNIKDKKMMKPYAKYYGNTIKVTNTSKWGMTFALYME